MSYSDRFNRAMILVLNIEGAYSNDKRDPGGETVWGISRVHHPEMFKDGPPTKEQSKRFYWETFWLPLRADELSSERIAIDLFDFALNTSGSGHTGGSSLQKAVNAIRTPGMAQIVVDGRVGPKTIAAANHLCMRYENALFNAMNTIQGLHYLSVNNPDFARGWFGKRVSFS